MLTQTERDEIANQERLIAKYPYDDSFVRQCQQKIKHIYINELKREKGQV